MVDFDMNNNEMFTFNLLKGSVIFKSAQNSITHMIIGFKLKIYSESSKSQMIFQ